MFIEKLKEMCQKHDFKECNYDSDCTINNLCNKKVFNPLFKNIFRCLCETDFIFHDLLRYFNIFR